MNETIRNQLPTRTAVKELRKVFDDQGLSQRTNWQIETAFRTNAQTALHAGQYQEALDPDIDEILWGFEYVTVGDDRVRPEHEALDGTKLPKSDPFWQTYWPPNGYNCRCGVIEIFEPEPIKRPGTIDGIVPPPDPGFAANPGQLFTPGAG